MEAHDQWWAALGMGPQPMVEVIHLGGKIETPYGPYQNLNLETDLDLLDTVAEFGTVSTVSEHGYFLEPTEAGMYWACVANERRGSILVEGCDIAMLGEHYLELTEHKGDITATSEHKDYGREPQGGWSIMPPYSWDVLEE